MSAYIAFTKKEFLEHTRNYKLLSMLTLFLIVGFLSPLSAKFMPELVASLAPDLQSVISEPSALDSWMQFYKNMSSLGMSLMLIIFCSLLSSEYSKGTLVIMLTKGLPRPAVIWSKFSVTVLIMTVSFWASFLVTYGYTAYFWPGEALSHIFFSGFALWIMGLMYLAILMLGCVLFQQAFGSIIFLLGVTVAISLLGIPEKTAAYSPSFLASKNVDLLSGAAAVSEFSVPILIALCISIFCLAAAIILFDKKQV